MKATRCCIASPFALQQESHAVSPQEPPLLAGLDNPIEQFQAALAAASTGDLAAHQHAAPEVAKTGARIFGVLNELYPASPTLALANELCRAADIILGQKPTIDLALAALAAVLGARQAGSAMPSSSMR